MLKSLVSIHTLTLRYLLIILIEIWTRKRGLQKVFWVLQLICQHEDHSFVKLIGAFIYINFNANEFIKTISMPIYVHEPKHQPSAFVVLFALFSHKTLNRRPIRAGQWECLSLLLHCHGLESCIFFCWQL